MTNDQIQMLIDRSLRHDAEAFSILVAEYQPLVFRLAFRLLCNEEEAKDMTQETFIKVWLSLYRYHPKFRFSTWLYKITANTCYDRLRVLQHEPNQSKNSITASDADLTSSHTIEEEVANKELKELIIRFTDKLTPKQKLVFVLQDIEGLEPQEISAITGLSAAKIKSNLYLARKSIKKKLNEIDPDL